jgi:hypothetical protein
MDRVSLWSSSGSFSIIKSCFPTRVAEQRGVRNPLIGSANMLVKNPAEWFALLNFAAKAEPTDDAQSRERATMAGAFGDAIDARMPRGQSEPPTFDGEAQEVSSRPARAIPMGRVWAPRLRGPNARREPHF